MQDSKTHRIDVLTIANVRHSLLAQANSVLARRYSIELLYTQKNTHTAKDKRMRSVLGYKSVREIVRRQQHPIPDFGTYIQHAKRLGKIEHHQKSMKNRLGRRELRFEANIPREVCETAVRGT
jgi:hypothetical protein